MDTYSLSIALDKQFKAELEKLSAEHRQELQQARNLSDYERIRAQNQRRIMDALLHISRKRKQLAFSMN